MPNFNTIVDAALHAVEQAEQDGHLHTADAEVVEAEPDDVVDAVHAAAHDAAAVLQPGPANDLFHAVSDFAHHARDLLVENLAEGHEVHEAASDPAGDPDHDPAVDHVDTPAAANHHDPYDDGQ